MRKSSTGVASHFSRYRRQASLSLLEAVNVPRRAVIADVGSGPGDALASLAATLPAARAVAIDLDRGSLTRAHRKGIPAVHATGDHLPLRSGSCDLVLALEVVEHLTDPAALLRECSRILRIHGRLLLSTPNRRSITGVSGSLLYRLAGRTWNAWDASHVNLMTPPDVQGLLREAGFAVDRCAGFWLVPDLPYVTRAVGNFPLPRFLLQPHLTEGGVDSGFVTMVLASKVS